MVEYLPVCKVAEHIDGDARSVNKRRLTPDKVFSFISFPAFSVPLPVFLSFLNL